jgi:glycosyltransferase involved in cell wall biosynthesis
MCMRIAQIASLSYSTPPPRHGGVERVVSYLTEELVRQNHEVVLFATADSQTAARLVPGAPEGIAFHDWPQQFVTYLLMLEQVYKHADQFDIIHSHIEHYHAPLARRTGTPTLVTVHNALDTELPWATRMFQEYTDLPLVSISNAQRVPYPQRNWQATVYHGLPEDCYTFQPRAGDYLAFLGRIDPEKGVEEAIKIAISAGIPLKIAGARDVLNYSYLDEIQHLLEHPLIEYVGEVTDAEKQELLGNAAAFLFPIQWNEPFGLVMIEALACGTPVIAYNRGSVPEVISDGQTGFLVHSVDEAVAAINKIPSLDRQRCRREFEERFTDRRMVQDYLAVYEQQIARKRAILQR